MRTSTGGVIATHYFSIGPGSAFEEAVDHAFAQRASLYADPETNVVIDVWSRGGSGESDCEVTISGTRVAL